MLAVKFLLLFGLFLLVKGQMYWTCMTNLPIVEPPRDRHTGYYCGMEHRSSGHNVHMKWKRETGRYGGSSAGFLALIPNGPAGMGSFAQLRLPSVSQMFTSFCLNIHFLNFGGEHGCADKITRILGETCTNHYSHIDSIGGYPNTGSKSTYEYKVSFDYSVDNIVIRTISTDSTASCTRITRMWIKGFFCNHRSIDAGRRTGAPRCPNAPLPTTTPTTPTTPPPPTDPPAPGEPPRTTRRTTARPTTIARTTRPPQTTVTTEPYTFPETDPATSTATTPSTTTSGPIFTSPTPTTEYVPVVQEVQETRIDGSVLISQTGSASRSRVPFTVVVALLVLCAELIHALTQ